MKSLYPEVDWNKIQIVGFDMDGTLYDELFFIRQVYSPISRLIASEIGENAELIYVKMVNRWMEKGSSYPYIFSEMLEKHQLTEDDRNSIISECLRIFRSFKPQLSLTGEVRSILERFHFNFPLFLITDGHAVLQKSKLESLGLGKFFIPENIGISGMYGKDYQKPSIKIIDKIKALEFQDPFSVLYFGDREVDAQFANDSGFHFVRVNCMRIEVGR